MSLIEIDNLTCLFSDGTLALNGIDLFIDAGSFLLLAGRNGAGKTTLLRHLNGLLVPDSGEVRLDRVPVAKDLPRARQMVGMVFQDADSQIVGETVFDDVAFGPENLCWPTQKIKTKVGAALESVGIAALADHRPHTLSGGEKRRLAIAGILVMDPQVIILDEPFSNLDYPGTVQVLKTIADLHAGGRTVIITTHDIEKVFALADRMVIMERGRIVRDGRPMEVVADTEKFGIRMPCALKAGGEVASWLT
ncbi:MAG: ABC transporter ATP-binding protein [Desulfobacterales bacterium]|nr:ABC transporter ATP-binding protein [Desulfobacterales bacterium]